MLHCSLEKRLVEMQIKKFKKFHNARYPPKQTTYADNGWNNPERLALLMTQRLFYVDMILNKIELAKWSLNKMWGSQAMNNAAEKAGVDSNIITGSQLHELSIEMLRCATSWLIFERHYSAEMDRINDMPKKQAQDKPPPTQMRLVHNSNHHPKPGQSKAKKANEKGQNHVKPQKSKPIVNKTDPNPNTARYL